MDPIPCVVQIDGRWVFRIGTHVNGFGTGHVSKFWLFFVLCRMSYGLSR